MDETTSLKMISSLMEQLIKTVDIINKLLDRVAALEEEMREIKAINKQVN